MKKDIVMFKNGSFVDFQGVTRQFIVCALSTSNFKEHDAYLTIYDGEGMTEGEVEIPRAVFIGISICNPIDEWDEAKGKMIAEAKARGFKPDAPEKSAVIFTTRAGMISETLVQALLDREVEHIKEDPEYAIKGYNQMKARWEEKQEMEKYVKETPENLVNLADQLKGLSEDDIARVINVALIKSYE